MSDDTSKLATEYKPEAIAFFRLVVRYSLSPSPFSSLTRSLDTGGEDHDDARHGLLLLHDRGHPPLLKCSHNSRSHETRRSRHPQESHRQGCVSSPCPLIRTNV